MVAISLPKSELDEWYGVPAEAPLAGGEPRPSGPTRPTVRRLPDRATRWRRRRLAVLVAGSFLALVVAGAVQVVGPMLDSSGGQAGSSVADQGSSPAAVEGEVYVVQPGDTLWTVAAQVAPDRDPRPIVDRLRDVNGGTALDAGDRLVIDLG